MNKFFTKIASAVLGLAMAVGVGAVVASNLREARVAEAGEELAYTLEPATGSNNGYASNCDITIDGITWNLTGNSTMQPWRIGGKNLTNVDRTLYSKTAIDKNISKIVVTHGTADSVTVNSFKLIVASDANFSSIIETKTIDFEKSSDTEITPSTSMQWTNAYYKFVYNVTIGGSNKYIQFTRAKFYSTDNETPGSGGGETGGETGGDDGGEDQISGIEATLSFDSLEQRTYKDEKQQIWQQNNITLTNNKGQSTTNIADYSNPARFYKNSEVIIEAPGNIVKITFNANDADSLKYAKPLKDSLADFTDCSIQENIITLELDGTTPSINFICSAQIRLNSLTVKYIESSTPSPTTHTVTFFGATIPPQTIEDGGKVVRPEDPTLAGYIFGGWFTEEGLTNEYNFDTVVNSSFNLYAKWTKIELNFERTLINTIDDLKTNDIFVLSSDNSLFVNGSITSNSLQLTDDLSNIGYFTLVNSEEGYLLALVLKSNDSYQLSGKFVGNTDSTNLELSESSNTIWELIEDTSEDTSRVYLNVASSGRYLGVNGNNVKAYAESNISNYPPVYIYKVGSFETGECTKIRLTNLPDSPLKIGDEHNFDYIAYDQNGVECEISNVVYTSSNPEVGEITNDGLFTANNAGLTRITVKYTEEIYHYADIVISNDEETVEPEQPEQTEDTIIVFELGANGSATHKDGSSDQTTYSETDGSYALSITGGSKMYPASYDAKGNSCIKFGTGSAVGKMNFTVPADVTKVILELAKYKTNASKVTINGTTTTLTKNSNDGAYDVIEVDTSSTKTVNFTTVSGGYRVMLNTIKYVIPGTPSTEGGDSGQDADLTAVQAFANDYLKMDNKDYDHDGVTTSCAENYSAAKEAYAGLTAAQKALFASEAEFADAVTRFKKWAIANGETFDPTAYTFVQNSRYLGTIVKDQGTAILIVSISLVSVAAIGGYFFLKKRKEQ